MYKEKKVYIPKDEYLRIGNYLVILQYASWRIWRMIEDSGTSYQEFLVARSNKRNEKICRRV